MQGSDIDSHFFDLHSIHSKTRTINLLRLWANTTGEKSFDFSAGLLLDHSFVFSAGRPPGFGPLSRRDSPPPHSGPGHPLLPGPQPRPARNPTAMENEQQ